MRFKNLGLDHIKLPKWVQHNLYFHLERKGEDNVLVKAITYSIDDEQFNKVEKDFRYTRVITTTVHEVMKSGVKVAIGNDKKLIVTIKKSQLAKEATNQRAEIFQPGNKLDASIIELDIPNRKASLSVKQAQIDEEKTLIKKYGKDAKSSGAKLKEIFNKALNITKTKKKK